MFLLFISGSSIRWINGIKFIWSLENNVYGLHYLIENFNALLVLITRTSSFFIFFQRNKMSTMSVSAVSYVYGPPVHTCVRTTRDTRLYGELGWAHALSSKLKKCFHIATLSKVATVKELIYACYITTVYECTVILQLSIAKMACEMKTISLVCSFFFNPLYNIKNWIYSTALSFYFS